MGFNTSVMTKILLGVGFGILMVFGLIATACFGKYANSYSKFEKIEFKLDLNPTSKAIDISIAIAVLGCISAVAAITGIALSILMDGQSLILIIVGGVSALFAFGCIVAEGVFIQTCENYILDDGINKGAQKHIKNSIKDLYEAGYDALNKENTNLLTWSQVESHFGEVHENSDGKFIFAYKHIWPGYGSPFENSVSLQKSSGYIYASCSDCSGSIKIASTRFIYNGSYTPKQRYCWFKDINKLEGFKCKNIKMEKENDQNDMQSPPTISQYIVVDKYISPTDADEQGIDDVDYQVKGFPVFYHKFNSDEIKKFKEIDSYDYNLGNYFEKDTKHFKVKAKDYLKAEFNENSKEYTKPSDFEFKLVPKKVSNLNDVKRFCSDDDESGGDDEYGKKKLLEDYGLNFCDDYETSYIGDLIQQTYKDANKGKLNSFSKKQTKKEYLPGLRNAWNQHFAYYYNVALMCMIVQIFGIIFWACGKFLGLFLEGGSDAKTASEGEA